MRPKKIELLFEQLKTQPSVSLDRRIANLIKQSAIDPEYKPLQRALWRRIMESKYTKVVAGIGILISLFYLAAYLTGQPLKSPSDPERVAVEPNEKTHTSPSEAELALAQLYYEQRDIDGLLNMLTKSQAQTSTAVLNYLVEIGGVEVIPTLQAIAETWEGDQAELLNKAIKAIQQRPVVDSNESNRASPNLIPMVQPELYPVPKSSPHINPNANGVCLEVLVTHEQTDKPLAGTEVKVWSNSHWETGLTDANGLCRIGWEQVDLPWAEIRVHCPGFVSMRSEFKDLRQKESAYRIHCALEKAGGPIGGMVVDANDHPLPQVKVDCHSNYDPSADRTRHPCIDYEVLSDERGRWTCDRIPIEVNNLWVEYSHPDYPNHAVMVADPYLTDPNWVVLEALRDQSHKLTMIAGISVHGQVTDANGTPIPDTEIMMSRWSDKHRVRTDSLLRYSMTVRLKKEPLCVGSVTVTLSYRHPKAL